MSTPDPASALVLSPTPPSPKVRSFFHSRFGPDLSFADLTSLRRSSLKASLARLRATRVRSVVITGEPEEPGPLADYLVVLAFFVPAALRERQLPGWEASSLGAGELARSFFRIAIGLLAGVASLAGAWLRVCRLAWAPFVPRRLDAPKRCLYLKPALSAPLWRASARRWGLLDRPNVRSSHQTVVPRGGGAAIVLAALVGVSASGSAWEGRPGTAPLLVGALALALVGLWDDRFGLSPLRRFAFQLAAAMAVVVAGAGIDRLPLPPPLDLPFHGLGAVFAVLWIVAVVNFYNFLDGIDGLAALQGGVTGLGLALVAGDPLSAGLGAALGCLGFLLFNWPPATIFMGDIGNPGRGPCCSWL